MIAQNSPYPIMLHALRLAVQGLGEVWPNPAVGCVIMQGERVVGVGRTQRGGRPHAETQALAMAGAAARGATLFVTLEPCAHHGQTSPCAEAIIEAGIARVVVAYGDPDPRVNGRGIAMLRAAGIEVAQGIATAQAEALNQGFFLRVQQGRPLVTLKIATTVDGFIAPLKAQTMTLVTCAAARQHGHLLRATHDAILVGSGTVLADDPQLTCRLPGLEHRSPQRVVLDRQGRMPQAARMLHDGAGEIWVLGQEYPTIVDALAHLAARGITRLLVEGGSRVNAAFLQAGLIDDLYWYRAPHSFGEGVSAFAGMALPAALEGFTLQQTRRLGADSCCLFTRSLLG